MDYDKLFGGGAMAAHYGLQDRDVELETTRLAQQQAAENIRSKQLSNLFDEQNNPYRLEDARLKNEEAGYNNRKAAIDTNIAEQTKELKLNQVQRDLIMKASKADLDGFEIKAQQMAYSPDPKIREQGLSALRMHKDFVKMRDDAKLNQETTAANEATKFGYDVKLENLRSGNARSLEALRAKNKGDTGQDPPKMTKDNLMGTMWQAEQQWRTATTPEAKAAAQREYEKAAQMLTYYNAVAMEGKADPTIGKFVMKDGAPAPMEPRQPVQPPPLGNAPAKPAAQAAPPRAAVQYLLQNPHQAAAFDAKYGRGASAQYLGK